MNYSDYISYKLGSINNTYFANTFSEVSGIIIKDFNIVYNV
ncbi:hypothetical protein [Flavobacterium sp.]|nr:hypothetical protein [Flavobacterium sp.]HLF53082.1 hypothetical protein [Flavobacterium sp.]